MDNKKYGLEILKLRVLIKNKKLIGNELIKYIDDNNFYEYINKAAEKLICDNMNNLVINQDKYHEVLISLTMIALKNYDGKFWQYVEKEYSSLYERFSEQKVYGKIKEILEKFREGDSVRYIDFPIINAIVPVNYLSRYYEFMYDIYKINFQRSLPDNLKEELTYILEELNCYIKDGSEDLEIATTNKTYKLIKTTQNIIKNKKDLDQLVSLSETVLKCIDGYYWNDIKIDYEDTSYFYEGLRNFEKTNKEAIKYSGNKKEIEERENSSRWKPKYKLSNDKVYLMTPIHRVPKEINPNSVYIVVYNKEEILYNDYKPIIEEVIGGYIIRPNNILIKNPIGEISYKILNGENILYDSGDALYRNYFIFNEDGNEIKNNTNYSGIANILCNKIENDNISIYAKTNYYEVGSLVVNLGDTLILKDNIIHFSIIPKLGVNGIEEEKAKIIINNNEIKVYKRVYEFSFATMIETNNLGISINKKNYRLINLEFSEKLDSNNLRNITIKLENITGLYDLRVFNIRTDETIEKQSFVVDEKLSWTTQEIKEHSYLIELESSFTLLDDLDNVTNKFYMNSNEETEPNINVKLGKGNKGTYILNTGIIFYKVSNESKWQEADCNLWYKDIGFFSKMYFKNVNFNIVELQDNTKRVLANLQIDINNSCIDITNIKNYEEKDSYDIVLKQCQIERARITILNRCKYLINKSQIIYDLEKEKLKILTNYVGRNKVIVRIIRNVDSKICYEKELIGNSSEININGLKTFRTYIIRFFDKPEGFFKEEKVIFEKTMRFYNYTDFKEGRSFKISKAFYGIDIDSLKEHRLYQTFFEIDKKINKDKYIGKIYQIRNGKKIYMNNINPVKIELTTGIIKDSVYAQIQTIICDENEKNIEYNEEMEDYYEGLLLDRINNTIFNGDDGKLQDIFEYEIILGKS